MIPQIRYDFSEFERILFNLKRNNSSSLLTDLKNELNSFFKDSVCKEVIYTNNTDKLFFGMCVMPDIKAEDVYDILQSEDSYRINSYYLELDSKLFSPTLNFSARELTAVLLHEVGHIIKDTTPMEKVKNDINKYLAKNNQVIKISDSIHYKEILLFGIKDALRKVTSIFEQDGDELIADEFVVACGYGKDLESAFEKIVKNSYNINKDVDNKIIVLSYTLRVYKDIKLRRIQAIRSLNQGKALTPSKLEKREMDNVIRRLERLDDEALLESLLPSFTQLKYKGIKAYEDDVYEFNLRLKMINDENEALLLLHQINTRMAVIDDYINTEKISDQEKQRWFTLYNKYQKLREDLSDKKIYKDTSRLYVNYPDVLSPTGNN